MTYPLVVFDGLPYEYRYYTITQPSDGGMVIALGDATATDPYAAIMRVAKNDGPQSYGVYARSVTNPTVRYVNAKGKAGDVYHIEIANNRGAQLMWLYWCVSTDVAWNPWQNSAFSRTANRPYRSDGKGSDADVSGPPYVIGYNYGYFGSSSGSSHLRTARSSNVDHRVMPPPGTTAGYYVAKAQCDAGVNASIDPDRYMEYDRTGTGADFSYLGTNLGYSGGFIGNNYGFDSPTTVNLGAFSAIEWNFDPHRAFTNDAAGRLERDSLRYQPLWAQYQVNGLGARLGVPGGYYSGVSQGWIDSLDQIVFEFAEDWGPLNCKLNSYISLQYSWTRSIGAPYAGLWDPAGTGVPPRVVDPMTLSLRDAAAVPISEFSRWWTAGELNALPVVDSFTIPDPDPIQYSGLFESGGSASGSGFVHNGFRMGYVDSWQTVPNTGWALVDADIDQSSTYTKRLVTTNSIYPVGVSNIETVRNFGSFFFGYYFNDWTEVGALSGQLVQGYVYPSYRWGEIVEHFDPMPLPNLSGAVGPSRVHFAHINVGATATDGRIASS